MRFPCISPVGLTAAFTSIPEPEGRYLEDGYWRHGRFYGSWKHAKYLFPIDCVRKPRTCIFTSYILTRLKQEELKRLDIFHKIFLVARQNKPFRAPIVRQTPRLMDLGTGTGIWGIKVAEEYVRRLRSVS